MPREVCRSLGVYVIAEAGVNHNGSLEMAMELVDAAARAGADAIKFQTFRADSLVTVGAPKAEYQRLTTASDETQHTMLKGLELGPPAHKALLEHCRSRGIDFLSTPFDEESLDLLVHELGLRRIKISSGEIVSGPLLLQAARSGVDIILSTGMSTIAEVEMALAVLAFGFVSRDVTPSWEEIWRAYHSREGRSALEEKVVLLHCTSEYPAPFSDVNLRAMDTLRAAFGLPVGLSDHTEGIAVSIAAVARGAAVIEKHLTLDKNLPGPDHKASLEPEELADLVRSIRQVEQALGTGWKGPAPSEWSNRDLVRKSLIARREIVEGELFTPDNVTFKRPGGGLSPMRYWDVLGRRAPRSFAKDEVIEI